MKNPTTNHVTLAEQNINKSRRKFLKNISLITGGLVIGLPLTACADSPLPDKSQSALPMLYCKSLAIMKLIFTCLALKWGKAPIQV
jgi:hypothetical protein